MDHDETGCQAPPEGPILCINNCGFFGSVGTMNMCSKCYKDAILKQEQAQLAASSFENIVNGTPSSLSSSSCNKDKDPITIDSVDLEVKSIEPKIMISTKPDIVASGSEEIEDIKPNQGPNRCTSCQKRVGLTGFKCRCGNLFCPTHRYSDKHECPFDYQSAGREAIAKANPVVKAEKLDKI